MAQQPLVDQGLLIVEVARSYSDTPHTIGPLWTSHQPVVETCTAVLDNIQHSQETNIRAPGRIRSRNPSKGTAAASCVRQCFHRDRHT